MLRNTIAMLVAALLVGPTLALADEVTDQLDVAKEAYEAGNLGQAVDELQYAIAQIQELQQRDLMKLLPEPLAGWAAEPATAQSGGLAALAGGTILSRDYRKDSGEGVSLQIMGNSPMTQALSMMLANPMMLQMDPGSKMYRLKGNKGLIKHDAGTHSWEISVILRNGTLIQSSGEGLADKGPAEAYLKAIDFKAVEAAFAK